jgi:hypothetical protein
MRWYRSPRIASPVVARPKGDGQVSPLEFTGRGRAMDEQDRLWPVTDHGIRQRQPIVFVGEGAGHTRRLNHGDVLQIAT